MRFWIGLALGVLLGLTSPAWAFRAAKPPVLRDTTPGSLAQFNRGIEDLWNLTNGLYEVNEVTSNPNGSLPGRRNEVVHYNNAGSSKLCLNVSAAPGGKTWRCSANSLTAP